MMLSYCSTVVLAVEQQLEHVLQHRPVTAEVHQHEGSTSRPLLHPNEPFLLLKPPSSRALDPRSVTPSSLVDFSGHTTSVLLLPLLLLHLPIRDPIDSHSARVIGRHA